MDKLTMPIESLEEFCPGKGPDSMSASIDMSAITGNAPEFHGEHTIKAELQREQPHHRMMCVLLAQGYNATEVAEMTGYSNYTVHNVKNQEWAQKYIAELMEKAGAKAVYHMLSGETSINAIKMVQDAVGSENKLNLKPEERVKAAFKLLDKVFPTVQQVKMEMTTSDISNEELERIAGLR